jgi:hypothetical protein
MEAVVLTRYYITRYACERKLAVAIASALAAAKHALVLTSLEAAARLALI